MGLAVGYLADRAFGDPRRGHPVAVFGAAASWLEDRSYADRQRAGVMHTSALVGAAIGLGLVLERLIANRTLTTVMTTAAATWAVLGGRSLCREAATVAGQLADGKLIAARGQVRHLVGRDTAELSTEEVARATVESVAENASDAIVAPLLWGAVAGLPGLLGYRAANTLDAMIGHRSSRYLRFGWAAAQLDDLANWMPARVAALAAATWVPLETRSMSCAATPVSIPARMPALSRRRLPALSVSGLVGGTHITARWRIAAFWATVGPSPSQTSLGPAASRRRYR
jgi:adenosylcobinamide-phosphate synthase